MMDRIDDLKLLHHKAKPRFTALAETLARGYKSGFTKTEFKVFETFRHPLRQLKLFEIGTTKARAWQSAHQYGLAVDFVPVLHGNEWNWSDDHDYDYLATEARKHGLEVPIKWDPCHVQDPLFAMMRRYVI